MNFCTTTSVPGQGAGAKILYIEDDAVVARMVQAKLERGGYTIDLASDGGEGVAAFAEHDYDLVAVDYEMPGHDGLEVIRMLSSSGPLPPTIMITGAGSEAVAVEAIRLGAHEYLVKDIGLSYLKLLPTVIERALQQHRIQQEQQRAEEELRKSEERYRLLFEKVPVGVFRTALDGRILEANPTLVRLLGYPDSEELKNVSGTQLYVDPGQRRHLLTQIDQEGAAECEVQWYKRDGNPIWMHEATRVVRDDQGRVAFYDGVVEDISFRRKAEIKARKALLRIEGLRTIAEAVLAAQSTAEIAQAALKHTRNLIPCSCAVFLDIDETSGESAVLECMATAEFRLEPGSRFPAQELPLDLLSQGEVSLLRDLAAGPFDSGIAEKLSKAGMRSSLSVPLIACGKLTGVLCLGSIEPNSFSEEHIRIACEVAESVGVALHGARLTEDIRELAVTDSLTGLHNRRNLFELGRLEFERSSRFKRSFSAVMLDIDHFKRVNDTHGHLTGDEILQILGDRCRETARTIDIIGRYGGDEFVVLMPETGLPGAVRLAERLRLSVANAPMLTKNGSVEITISLGVAEMNEDTADLSALIDHADTSMLTAKRDGRKCLRSPGQGQPGNDTA
ncbi:MAG: diguanylate cyclase [Acidobacteriota bacterium]